MSAHEVRLIIPAKDAHLASVLLDLFGTDADNIDVGEAYSSLDKVMTFMVERGAEDVMIGELREPYYVIRRIRDALRPFSNGA